MLSVKRLCQLSHMNTLTIYISLFLSWCVCVCVKSLLCSMENLLFPAKKQEAVCTAFCRAILPFKTLYNLVYIYSTDSIHTLANPHGLTWVVIKIFGADKHMIKLGSVYVSIYIYIRLHTHFTQSYTRYRICYHFLSGSFVCAQIKL